MKVNKQISSRQAVERGYGTEEVEKIKVLEQAQVSAGVLIDEVLLAFPASIPRPRITRSVARALDDEAAFNEQKILELAAADAEQQWPDLSDEDIEGDQGYFFNSDPEGWRFYLPAYLCHALRDFPSGWPAVEYACETQRHVSLLYEAQLSCLNRFNQLRAKYDPQGWQDRLLGDADAQVAQLKAMQVRNQTLRQRLNQKNEF